MKLTQLSSSEFKLDAVGDFCLSSHGNCQIVVGNSSEISVLELMDSYNTIILMPYSNKQIPICQDKPISDIIKTIDLVKIYENGNVQETQELALDVIYTAECSTEPLKARVLQADVITRDNTIVCCILTTYGHCEIFKKTAITQEWKPVGTNLSTILITDVFTKKVLASHIKTYNDLKTFASKYIITCFVMSERLSDLLIYLGTAAGYVIAIKYDESSRRFNALCHLKTALNRVSYILTYNNLILIGCDQGTIRLVKIDFESNCMQELDYLWSKKDRMSCRKAIFTYCEELRSYLVVFCKTAHVLIYRLDLNGAVITSSTLYVSGIKITGLETISKNEFIITTIMGGIKYIKVSCPTTEELNIEEQVVEHDFDSANYQILGLTVSPSKNLWSFVRFRNKEYVTRSKYMNSTAFLNVCKLSSEDSFIKLINLNIKNMNMAQDLITAIHLDIFNNQDVDKYASYCDLEKVKFPNEFTDAFIQKLQIKIIIVRFMAAFQNIKYKKIKPQTNNELQVLEHILKLLHILTRLRYFNQLNTKDIKLSKFQEMSTICLQLEFNNLLTNFLALKHFEDEDKPLKAVDNFSLPIQNEFEKYKFDTDNFSKQTEYCMMCNQAIISFEKCEQGHEIKRCSVSYTQLTLFQTIHCPHCFTMARNDKEVDLQELYATDESITCVYCRFLLKKDEL